MRIWSLHPKYLDSKGLVALWREGLLALEVLKGQTKGYKKHPQLIRFQNANNPKQMIKQYLWHVYKEAVSRGYNFNIQKIKNRIKVQKITVTTGQLIYEMKHLHLKLKTRNYEKYKQNVNIKLPDANPIFRIIDGMIESWEKI